MLATEAQPSAQILATAAGEQGLKVIDPSQADSSEGWQLVWCHERCHKVDLDPVRDAFTEAIGKANGSLVCLKKATGFGRWVSRMPNVPFVLLADWREAKPCWDILSEDVPHEMQLTVVYTEQERQFKQASQWAASLRARGARNIIHVVPVHITSADLADYAVRLLQRNKAMVCPAGMRRIASHPGTTLPLANGACEGLRRATSSNGVSNLASPISEGIRRVSSFPGFCQAEALLGAAGPPPGVWAARAQALWACKPGAYPGPQVSVQIDQSMDWAALEQWQEAAEGEGLALQRLAGKALLPPWPQRLGGMAPGTPQKGTPPCSPTSTDWCCTSPGGSPFSFVEAEQGKWSKPVAAVLASIFKSESGQDIQFMLQQSEPDHYED